MTGQISTSPVAVSMGRPNGLRESEARLKVRNEAENLSIAMTSYNSSDRDNYPYNLILKGVDKDCVDSTKLTMEGVRITYDVYTSVVDGNTYVRGILTFKYKCPELSPLGSINR
jgi:hypothetical protein